LKYKKRELAVHIWRVIMPIQEFEIKDIAALKYVKCTNVPKVMIITWPNGVGKPTLLEEITNFLRDPRRGACVRGSNISIKIGNDPIPCIYCHIEN